MSKKLWSLRGVQIRADDGLGQHVATYMTNRDDGQLLAAAPRLLAMLVDACETFDALERSARSSSTADSIKEELERLCPVAYAKARADAGI